MEQTTRTAPRTGRSNPESVRAGAREVRELDRDTQYDLLTAALLGVAVGAAATLLIGSGMRPQPKVHPLRAVLTGGGRRKGRRKGGLSPEVMRHHVADLMETARDTVADTVEAELKDLRRSIRRQRRRLGL